MDQSFRDSIATIGKEGKRNWIFAQKPKGKFYMARTIISGFYLTLFFSLPFVEVHGRPFFLFNILERKFIFFGVTFWPQDFFIFGIGMLTFILFVVLFTVVYGRVFCGWACPQTIFMEMIFRRIEYWIEGDASHQKILDQTPYNIEKIVKKGVKHSVFFLLAFLIANTFLSYIIGVNNLFKIIREPLSQHIGGFISLLLFTGVFYAVYAWFREQVCLIVCPYGRLQAVMTDKNSLLVAYDYIRGEPREKFKKMDTKSHGDCIDCFHCVKVCPMGIDIRNGTQLECTNCTACIDSCDQIMNKVGKPTGLIRFASEKGIAEKEKFKFSSRAKSYTAILILLVGFLIALLTTRNDIAVTVLRTPGLLFQNQGKDSVSNLYNIKILNKTLESIPVELRMESGIGKIKLVGKPLRLMPDSKTESEFFIILPKTAIQQRKTILIVEMYSKGKKLQNIKTSFLGPIH
jgi:cytochrome c oxidase accessory protein FixG